MLLISSETIRSSAALNDVAREMSFTLSFFASPAKLEELMGGQSRRIVVLCEADIANETLQTLRLAAERMPFAILVAADRSALRSSNKSDLVEQLVGFENLEWVGSQFDFDALSASARRCRRRMLKVSRQDLEGAFDNSEFVLRYQPKVGRISGSEWHTREAEALIRWQSPRHGLMGPLEFLPEIEAFEMVGRLHEFVLREAAGQLVAWSRKGIKLDSCINLASSLLNDPGLAANCAAIVEEVGVDCSRFTFEVIEQDLGSPDAPHLKTLRELRDRGFRICLDDFRVAATSLGTFEQLPLDEIKIHASALKRAQGDKVAQTVLAAVTGLAHNLGMSVCAEGVEDDATFEFLKTIECDKMQGFLISEAVLPEIIRQVYTASDGAGEEVA